jgi:hypothetical protein
LLESDLGDARADWNAAYRDILKLGKDVAYYRAALADVLSAVEEEHPGYVEIEWWMSDFPTVRAYKRYAKC